MKNFESGQLRRVNVTESSSGSEEIDDDEIDLEELSDEDLGDSDAEVGSNDEEDNLRAGSVSHLSQS